ncbi:hypothetical protein BGW80DRAFT_1254851 [Lactifluus volemus]|nr:hypothetical protein BGW80DRAFT_1254851 [Lactifluus volemus]
MPSSSTSSSPFSDALSSYQNQTKVDISKHPLLPRLQNCNSPKTILDELRVQAPEFVQIEAALPPTVDVLHAFSPTLGKSLARCISDGLYSISLFSQPPLQEYTPSDAILAAIGILLKVYTGVTLTERLKGLIVQFMAKVLSILAIPITQRPPTPFDQLKRSFSPKNQPSKGSNFSLDQAYLIRLTS